MANNAKSAAPSGSEIKKSDEKFIPQRRQLAMGMNPKTGSGTGPKTPA